MLIIFDYICLYCRLACIFLRVLFCIRIIMYELKSLESIDNLPTIRIGVDPTFKAYQNVQVCRLKNAPRDFICTDFSSGACFNMLVRHCLGATISCARLRVPECFCCSWSSWREMYANANLYLNWSMFPICLSHLWPHVTQYNTMIKCSDIIDIT